MNQQPLISQSTETTPDFDKDIAKFSPRQMEAVRHLDSGLIKFLLYGGALGGGKSYFLRWYAIRRLIVIFKLFGLRNVTGMLACEDYPSLKDRQLQKISREIPAWIGTMHQDHKEYGRCFILHEKWGGGILCFRNLDDPSKYASAEFAFILVDELTKNEYDIFTFLRTRLRWPGLPDVECQFVAGTNPGSIGHGWVKQLWMDKLFPVEWIEPNDYRSQFAYVPSLADDNPHLDPSYWAMLNTLPENLRKAFRYGDWDIFVGQAFPEFSKVAHTIEPVPVPEHAPLYMTFDWGYGAPFSIMWWWVDADNRLYGFSEWYGWNGNANEGLRLTDSRIAEGIIAREEALGIKGRQITRLAGPDCFSKKPSYLTGGQGPSTAEVFADKKYDLHLIPGDPTRKTKIRQFRERLRYEVDEKGNPRTMPMLVVYNTCEQFIRTIPNMVMSELDIEDVDTKGEDHIYDSACHVVQARPISLEELKPRKSQWERRIDELMRDKEEGDGFETEARLASRQALSDLGVDLWDEEDRFLDRGEVVETMV
ncbi:MAG: phage terminase large subunit [Candidatus Neomarinimicrobiota bacterium]